LSLNVAAMLTRGVRFGALALALLAGVLVNAVTPAAAGPIAARGGTQSVAYAASSTRSIGLNVPSGAQAGDVLVAAIGVGRNGTNHPVVITAPSGWTLVQRTNDGNQSTLALYTHVLRSGETRYTWSTDAKVGGTAFLAAFGGVDTARPVDVAGGVLVTTTNRPTTPSLTTTVADTQLVAAWHAYDANGTGTTWTPPSGMSELAERTSGGTRSGSVATKPQTTAGATGAQTATTSAVQDRALGALVALRPAGAVPPPPPPSAGGAITVRGPASAAAYASEATRTIAVDAPTGAGAGGVRGAALGFGRSGASRQPTLTAPAGWTLANRTNQGTDAALAVFWHVFAAGETRYSWTTDVTVGGTAFVAAFGGVNPQTPVDAVVGRSQTTSFREVATASVTTSVADTLLLGAWYGYDSGGAGSTWSPPTDMAELGDRNNGGSRSGSLAQRTQAGAGVSGTKTATASTSQDRSLATLMGLRPGTAVADTRAPSITAVAAGTPSSSGTTITWTTDEAADTQVEYGPTTAYGSTTPLDTAKVTSHSATISGLTADRLYNFRVRSRDASGNLAVSANATFRTAAAGGGPTPLIVDTDIFSDADDVGALATAFALQGLGEAQVIAIGVNTRTSRPAVATNSWRCAAAVAQFYRSASVPIGTHLPNNGTETNTDEFVGPCATRAASNTPAPDSAVRVFRRALAQQPDGSVVIAQAGYNGNLSDLLASPADSISSLTGRELVARKVRALVVMGGGYPSRSGENNLQGDIAAAQDVANNWPSRIVWAGYEVGDLIHTGDTISTTHPSTSPVRISYEAFVGPRKWLYSYDLVAVYHAVRADDPSLGLVGPGRNTVTSNGGNQFTMSSSGNQWYLRLNDQQRLEDAIEALLGRQP
jgi:hypothetical protein